MQQHEAQDRELHYIGGETMTFKALSIYFATVVLTAAVAIGVLLLFLSSVNPADRYTSYSWAFVAFTLIVMTGTIAGICAQSDYEVRAARR